MNLLGLTFARTLVGRATAPSRVDKPPPALDAVEPNCTSYLAHKRDRREIWLNGNRCCGPEEVGYLLCCTLVGPDGHKRTRGKVEAARVGRSTDRWRHQPRAGWINGRC
ncbi:uncharacterized protein P884DRAFT_22732 [Thermothelomyces heterothallicus CBS 202.75]|uniref:uncharacterized protein n=1 Tax=Thermothelomyces heterothallicus CBS 202.75 TaxID=1149848 RepID=UPI00374254BF